MKRMYLSKAQCLHTCARKYHFQYHTQIGLKEEALHFKIGRVFHKMAETYIKEDIAQAKRLLDIEPLTQKDKDLLLGLFTSPNKENTLTFDTMLKDIKGKMLSTENVIIHPINDEWEWIIKSDLVCGFEDGVWMYEFKTASGYGPSTAAYYHNSPQTWVYLYISKQHLPDLRGSRFPIVTKTKSPLFHLEEIHYVNEKALIAELAIKDTIEEATLIEKEGAYNRRGTQCRTKYSECDFMKICWLYNPVNFTVEKGVNHKYVEEVLNTFYTKKDPEEHLFGVKDD